MLVRDNPGSTANASLVPSIVASGVCWVLLWLLWRKRISLKGKAGIASIAGSNKSLRNAENGQLLVSSAHPLGTNVAE
jgi:hypothetical protein